MKYGYNDYEWCEGCESWNKFCGEVRMFNINCFQNFMKRKTFDEKDEKMLNALNEMVEMMNAHKNEMVRKNRG